MARDPRQVNKTFSIMGSSFVMGAGALIDKLTNRIGQMLELRREPNNPVDKNAIQVFWGARQLGWVPRGLAAQVAPYMDRGVNVICRKAAGVAGFKGAVRGVMELAYIPDDQPEVSHASEPSADSTAESKRRL